MNDDASIEINVNNENLPKQIETAMDEIRATVWKDDDVQPHWRSRLVDQRTLKADLALGAQRKAEFEQMKGSQFRKTPTGEVLINSIEHVDAWLSETHFQYLWQDAISWARWSGQARLAKRLRRVFRHFYGAAPILSNEFSFTPSGQTVWYVANEIRRIALGHSGAGPKLVDWLHAEDGALHITDIDQVLGGIHWALERRGLLDNPLVSKIGRQLDFAYRAVLFNRRLWQMNHHWAGRIFDALNTPNQRLAAALMRLYGHYNGRVFLMNTTVEAHPAEGERIDWPSCGSCHVPDDPTVEEAKKCLLEANPLRAEWVKRLEQQEQTEAGSSSVEDEHDGQLSHELD